VKPTTTISQTQIASITNAVANATTLAPVTTTSTTAPTTISQTQIASITNTVANATALAPVTTTPTTAPTTMSNTWPQMSQTQQTAEGSPKFNPYADILPVLDWQNLLQQELNIIGKVLGGIL
jgi:hypothetical protein